jgi:hypothetical protein
MEFVDNTTCLSVFGYFGLFRIGACGWRPIASCPVASSKPPSGRQLRLGSRLLFVAHYSLLLPPELYFPRPTCRHPKLQTSESTPIKHVFVKYLIMLHFVIKYLIRLVFQVYTPSV